MFYFILYTREDKVNMNVSLGEIDDVSFDEQICKILDVVIVLVFTCFYVFMVMITSYGTEVFNLLLHSIYYLTYPCNLIVLRARWGEVQFEKEARATSDVGISFVDLFSSTSILS